MNFKECDINKLVILWQANDSNPEIRIKIEEILNDRIVQNQTFSREFIFDKLFIGKKPLLISFIPTSVSFKKFGQNIVVEENYNENEIIELLNNFREKPPKNTFGIVKAKLLITEEFSEEQIESLKLNGFHTNEILSII